MTDANDMREIVGLAGVVLPPGVPERLAAALEELRSSPERRSALGQHASCAPSRGVAAIHHGMGLLKP